MLVITCEGGLVRSVNSDDPNLIGQEVTIVDYDTENGDSSDCHYIPQGDNEPVSAYVSKQEIVIIRSDIADALTELEEQGDL